MLNKRTILAAGMLANLLFGGTASADEPRLFEGPPDPHELADFLFTESVGKSKTRSVFADPTQTKESSNVAALLIQFEFDSAEIKPSSVEIVERLAQALITRQAGTTPVMIEGHTDAVGSETYNMTLSKRRAKAVREYLIDTYKIDPARLFVDGQGESALLTPEKPKAAVNRRVQIREFKRYQ